MANRSGIHISKRNRGKLRRTAGTKSGNKVSLATLRRLKRSKNPLTRRRATFALNAKTKFRNRGGKRRGGRKS